MKEYLKRYVILSRDFYTDCKICNKRIEKGTLCGYNNGSIIWINNAIIRKREHVHLEHLKRKQIMFVKGIDINNAKSFFKK